MTKVSVDLAGYPKGQEVSVGGLPMIENGGSLELTDEQVEDFKARNGQTLAQFFKGNDEVQVSSSSSTDKKGGD